MIVVADTTPVNYLVLIEEIEILSLLYGRVVIPASVSKELLHPQAPPAVRQWISNPPAWLEIATPKTIATEVLAHLDSGERDAILLAEEMDADLLILDELKGRRAAESRGLAVIGTLGVLRDAASLNLLDLPAALERLSRTNFHLSPAILNRLRRK